MRTLYAAAVAAGLALAGSATAHAATCYADPELAAELLGWRAERGIDEMCADHWRWQSANPEGFGAGDGS